MICKHKNPVKNIQKYQLILESLICKRCKSYTLPNSNNLWIESIKNNKKIKKDKKI